jgi:hypothetical protein
MLKPAVSVYWTIFGTILSNATEQRQCLVRPPKVENPILKYTVIAVVLGVIGWVGYTYLPSLLSEAQELGTSKAPAATATPAGTGAGPLGDVNGTMDVSDALEGNAPSKPPATVSKPPAVVQPRATSATNSVVKSGRHRQP